MFQQIALSLALVSVAAQAGENQVKFERNANTPMAYEVRGVQVNVYRLQGSVRQDPRCGVQVIGGGVIWNTCYVEDPVVDRQETLDVRVNFPVGSQLSGNDIEKYTLEFTNDYRHPEYDFGTVDISIKSKKHDYAKDSLKNIQARYRTMNDLNPRLR